METYQRPINYKVELNHPHLSSGDSSTLASGTCTKEVDVKTQEQGWKTHIDHDLESLILRLAKENPRWGYGKIEGELIKLGFKVSRTTIQNILRRHNIPPAPVRGGSISWRHWMSHYKQQILTTDFFTVETIKLQTLYVLFFIALGTGRVHISGVRSNPNGAWTTQQARQLVWKMEDRKNEFHFPLHDNAPSLQINLMRCFVLKTCVSLVPLPGTQCQRVCRAMDTHRQRRMPRSHSDFERSTFA